MRNEQDNRSGTYHCDLKTGQIQWSQGVYALLGYAPGEVVPSVQSFEARIHPEDLERIRAVRVAVQHAQPTGELRYRVVRPDGSVRHLRSLRHLLGDGRTLVGSLLDVTEEVNAAEAREREWAQLRMGEAIGRIGSFTMRLQDGTIHWSPMMYELMEEGPEHIPSAKDFDARVHPEDIHAIHAGRERLRTEGKGTAVVVRLRRRDGSWTHTFLDSRVQQSERGPLMIGCMQDVTHHVTLTRRLQDAERLEALGRLAGGIAHDVNNALALASGNLELLAERTSSDEITGLRTALDSITGMVRQLLAFARREVVPVGAVPLLKFVAERLVLLSGAAGSAVLTLDIPDGLPDIAIDPDRLQQVLINLLRNAQGASARTVLVRARAGEGGVNVDVVDDGEGMAAEVLGRVVEPFFTTRPQGTGMGLASVYGTMKAIGGALDISSVQGEGTTVSLRFRRATAESGASRAPAAACRVAVADDESALRQLVVRILKRAGIDVVAYGDGKDVLAALGEQPIDLLITDVRMPGLDGPSLVDALRRTRPDLRVLYMTGYAPDTSRLQEHPVLSKPFRPKCLVEAVQRALHGAPG